MQVGQISWSAQSGWALAPDFSSIADLVMVFADNDYFQTPACYNELRTLFPRACLVGCSTSGSVLGVNIHDANIVATVVRFEHARVRLTAVELNAEEGGGASGRRLMAELAEPDLKHVFILSDGLLVNGSELAQGLNAAGIPVTGGLAGDGTRFGQTWVMADAPARPGCIAALGFYGEVTVRSGCFAGWDAFGAERIVTKSSGNIVYEIDGEPALDLYKKYLGEQAADLPFSGLRFPLSIQATKSERPVMRTLLAVDEAAKSLTFAGDVPIAYFCKLMRTNLDSLIDSAGMAAESARPDRLEAAGLCLVVSCVGRRLVMGQLTEEELEIVQDKLGASTAITGFYSYGELAPFEDVMQCQLHNQTMTLTTLYEA